MSDKYTLNFFRDVQRGRVKVYISLVMFYHSWFLSLVSFSITHGLLKHSWFLSLVKFWISYEPLQHSWCFITRKRIDDYLLGHQLMYEVSQITPRAIFVIFQSGPAEKLPILPPFWPDNPKSTAPSVGNIFGHSIVLNTIHRLPSIPNPKKKREQKSESLIAVIRRLGFEWIIDGVVLPNCLVCTCEKAMTQVSSPKWSLPVDKKFKMQLKLRGWRLK